MVAAAAPVLMFREQETAVQRLADRPAPPKLVKLHWRPLPPTSLQGTVWQSLPQVEVNLAEFEQLFEVKDLGKKTQASTVKPKELLVLDPRRSNQINIGIKNLPRIQNLKSAILKMDDKSMTREHVEKLQALMPLEEEIFAIQEMEKENPGIPLGQAEQFLLTIHSIQGLECRLKLWAFKLDFQAMERDICEPLRALKDGIDRVMRSSGLAWYLSIILTVGNTLNRSGSVGFNLEYITKLSTVKDTGGSKKSLLHHIVKKAMESGVGQEMHEEFQCLKEVVKTDYGELQQNLAGMEAECKNSLGYLKLSSRYDRETGELVNTFLQDAAERIINMNRLHRRIMSSYHHLLAWFGLPHGLHSLGENDWSPRKLASLLLDFSREIRETEERIRREEAKSSYTRSAKKQVKERSSTVPIVTSSTTAALMGSCTVPLVNSSLSSLDKRPPGETCANPGYSADNLEAFLLEAAADLKKTKKKKAKASLTQVLDREH